ncbi:MAG: hypothetical protein ACHQCF_07635, partial [Solirubrobacterales bacterium]
MRKHLMSILAMAALVAIATGAIASASETGTVIRVGNLVLTINGGASPKALPKHELAPIVFHASGTIATSDGSQPPAVKEFVTDTGRTGEIDAEGIPVCKSGQLEAKTTEQAEAACPRAIVGRG